MYPNFKKITLLDETPASVLTSNTIPSQYYHHVIQTWKCLDCKYEGDDGTFIHKTKIISQTWNTCSTEGTIHCPKCDSQNIKFLEPTQFGIHHDETKID